MTAFRLAAVLTALVVAPAAYAQTERPVGGAAAAQSKVPQPRQEKMFPVGASWVAVSLNGKPFTGDRPGFTLDQQYRAHGFGGCNTFSATAYPLREQSLAVGPFALTKKTCDKNVMAIEHAFLVALRSSGKWDIEGSTLIIKTQSGDLKLERAL